MRFVTLVKFTEAGASKILQTARRAEGFTEEAKAAGVDIQALLWTQGHYDGVILFEAEDAEAAAALMLNLGSKGNVQTETMVAFDAEGMQRVLTRTK